MQVETLKPREVDEDVLLSVVCQEPEGEFERHVRLLTLTPSNLKTFWDKARQHRTLFSQEIRDSFHEFMKIIVRQDSSGGIFPTGLFWVIDDFIGVFYLTSIRPEVDALAHYTFFDGRHRGRKELCLRMLKLAFDTYNFRRLTVEIPMYAKEHTLGFVKYELGFKIEGRRRKATKFDGDWFDVFSLGLLREELQIE